MTSDSSNLLAGVTFMVPVTATWGYRAGAERIIARYS